MNSDDEESENSFSGWNCIDGYVETACCEVRARYVRCLVEVERDPKKLAGLLLNAMEVNAPVNPYRLELEEEKYPLLQDVIDATSTALPHGKLFLEEWKKILKNQESDRAHVLFMESVMMTDGLPALEHFVHGCGGKRPQGYVYLIQQLQKKFDWNAVISASLEALKNITETTFREQVSEYLIEASQKIDDSIMILTGFREKFLATLSRKDLVPCLVEAERQGQRNVEISILLKRFPASREQSSLQILMFLLAREVDVAFEKIKKCKVVDWSGDEGETGLLFSSLLTILMSSPKAVVTQNLLMRYADRDSYRMDWYDDQKPSRTVNVSGELMKSLQYFSPSPQQQKQWICWVYETAHQCIDHILTNKHRHDYGMAAEMLGALAEYHVLRKETNLARNLLVEHRDKKYNRFPAFKQELQKVLNSSALIKSLIPAK